MLFILSKARISEVVSVPDPKPLSVWTRIEIVLGGQKFDTSFQKMDPSIKKEECVGFACPMCTKNIVGMKEFKDHVSKCEPPDVKPISIPERRQPVREIANGVIEIVDSDEEGKPPAKKVILEHVSAFLLTCVKTKPRSELSGDDFTSNL